jgi:predicted nucleic-acid-binding Zn-ribbon protein
MKEPKKGAAPDFGPCPKCSSADRQGGRLIASELFPLQFDTDVVHSVTDSGPVRAIVCNHCKYLELYVGSS